MRSQLKGSQCFLLQLEKGHEIHPSKHLEARLPCRDSKTMSRSSSHLEWRLDFPGAAQEAP